MTITCYHELSPRVIESVPLPTRNLFEGARTKPPDTFLQPFRVRQQRKGARHTAQAHRTRQLLARLEAAKRTT